MEGDGLPTMICHKCMAALNIAWQFKQQCETSDMKLRQYFGSSQHLQVTPDLDGFSIIKEEQNLFSLTHDSQLLVSLPQQHTHPPLQTTQTIQETINVSCDCVRLVLSCNDLFLIANESRGDIPTADGN